MLTIFSMVLLFSTTTAQPYNATDRIFLACGSSTTTTTDRRWDGDQTSKFIPPNIITNSFSSKPDYVDPSFHQTPYSTARIVNTSSFVYKFPVSQGPKFLRLYFYPTTYSHHNPNQSYFSVSSNGYSLLTNFSASLTASYLKSESFVKEYIIYVKDIQILNVIFTPAPNSYAFINGIEIVSMPEDLYFNSKNPVKYVGMAIGPVVNNDMALENIYRLNMGGGSISDTQDTGMYRSWEPDDVYIYGTFHGVTPLYQKQTPVTYTTDTPNYTAPEDVYKTQRSMGKHDDKYNLTWRLPVDSGFFYKLRLHFCNIIPEYTKQGQMVFEIFINNQTADVEIDLFTLTQDSGYAVFKDYVVFVNDRDRDRGKQDLWVAMHPSPQSEQYHDAYLNGLEVFKLSLEGNLASPNPKPSSTTAPTGETTNGKTNKKKPPYAVIIGVVAGALLLLSFLVFVVLRRRRRSASNDKSSYTKSNSKSSHSTLPSDRCRRFSLAEVRAATREFNDDCVIGNGGFGKVYKGYIDNGSTVVAIKRQNEKSHQGINEFLTEINMLSKLRHDQLVTLIGYCEDDGEMILVYDYMFHGTLQEHLYKTNNEPLSWERRLKICIGAAKGLHYLHTGVERVIIHRDVKSTNILLDENWDAKVSDFGMSKLCPRDEEQNHVSTVVKGTIGYLDPEYFRTNQLTEKSDVYSFGVVLLEVLCARPVTNFRLPKEQKEQENLIEWGRSCYSNGNLNKIVDPKVRSVITEACLKKFGEVAFNCLKTKRSERPAMEEVVCGLELAMKQQEDPGKMVGEVVTKSQEFPFVMQVEMTTTDEDMFTGSSAVRSISSSDEGSKADAVIMKPEGR